MTVYISWKWSLCVSTSFITIFCLELNFAENMCEHTAEIDGEAWNQMERFDYALNLSFFHTAVMVQETKNWSSLKSLVQCQYFPQSTESALEYVRLSPRP